MEKIKITAAEVAIIFARHGICALADSPYFEEWAADANYWSSKYADLTAMAHIEFHAKQEASIFLAESRAAADERFEELEAVENCDDWGTSEGRRHGRM